MINLLKKLMNKITINGITKLVSGNNIRVEDVNNSKVVIKVDGLVVFESKSQDLNIKFEGDLANLNATHVSVSGNVHGNVDGTHVNIAGDVMGNVDGTHVTAKQIKGTVDAIHVNMKK